MNEKQKKAAISRRTTDSTRTLGQSTDSWDSLVLPRDRDTIQQQIITSKVATSQNLLN